MELKILVVDDDKNLCRLMEVYLKKEKYKVIVVNNGQEAINKFHEENPHLIILDIMLPKMNGWEVCQEIRKQSNIPILMLTAKGEKDDKLKGLGIGADDYVTKPFDPDELVARVKAILRRAGNIKRDGENLVFPNLKINNKKHQVILKGQELELAPKEYDLLYFLSKHEKQVFSREHLLDRVWGFDFIGDIRTVDTHIKRLRKKIDEQLDKYKYFHTVWGVGYKFEIIKED
ncbi:response regulator transcription factor [Orenia marismortui]|uniref:Stage 0 sporulation protein A homolog n=1 Tax=Orenia marismortui TaxID=46469 RepID=A0A4R8H980_9FIRM|nr:response regulator transcription factor [Orenia marismortui]TDX51563.1 two-component system response regulator ResD [Orenia marismortui]